MRAVALLLLALGGCGEPERVPPPAPGVEECDDLGSSESFVVSSLVFARQTEDGVAAGFDLDGEPGGTDAGCFMDDLTGADGEPDVDSSFSYVIPALELTEAAAVEGLIAQAISDGTLLITLDLDELDAERDDGCVDLTVGRAMGLPMLATDGTLLPSQTLDRNPDAPTWAVDDASLADGVIEVPLELSLPLQIFDVSLNFQLRGGRLRATRTEDGGLVGILAGGVDIQSLLDVAAEENVDDALHDILESLLRSRADLAPDESGECQQVSITFAFTAVPAFFFD